MAIGATEEVSPLNKTLFGLSGFIFCTASTSHDDCAEILNLRMNMNKTNQ